jgi:predicted amidophosphoribosyltransferase
MAKFSTDPPEPRQSFSHARTKPLVVEKMKRRTSLLCPSCGAKMKLIRKPELTACCPRCESK